MLKKKFIWIEKNGMHARPAGKLVSVASKYSSEITVSTEESLADAQSLFSLMGLKIKQDSEITLSVNGSDEVTALESVSGVLLSGLAKEVSDGSMLPSANSAVRHNLSKGE